MFSLLGDGQKLKDLYASWRTLSTRSVELGGRKVNIPEVLSEGAFALAYNVWRVNSSISGANSSFDCYDPNANVGLNRIQIKACSVVPDLTSFGPKSVWDRIFFADFFREGNWDFTFDVYEILTTDINSYKVNAHETVADLKKAGKRPRMKLYEAFVIPQKFISKKSYEITGTGVIRV